MTGDKIKFHPPHPLTPRTSLRIDLPARRQSIILRILQQDTNTLYIPHSTFLDLLLQHVDHTVTGIHRRDAPGERCHQKSQKSSPTADFENVQTWAFLRQGGEAV